MVKINNEEKVLFESDWLGSTPYFYNQKTGESSKLINDVITGDNVLKFHREGLYNFLDYGYSVFGQTPLEDVKFLKPASRLIKLQDGRLIEEKLTDPLEKWLNYSLSEGDIIDLIQERVQKWESKLSSDQKIILPLSGGFDSRLLLWCIKDKTRVKAFTYGFSQNQKKSSEVVYAKKLSEKYKLDWEQISIGKFHKYFDEWNDIYGLSTHAHGMYHFEFYEIIRRMLKKEHFFLSGIVGDVFAGDVKKIRIKNADDLIKLSYSHGLNADPKNLNFHCGKNLRDNFWIENKEELNDERFQIVTTIRFKIILLSYLFKIPSVFNFKPWSPYLDIDIAMAMLNLPKKRRLNRRWQTDFFKKVGLDIESLNLKTDKRNLLNINATIFHPLNPLDVELLSSLFNKKYINWINKNVFLNKINLLRASIFQIPKLGGILRRAGLKNFWNAYSAYISIKPIELYLKKNLK